jgi:hypothetical protein
MSTMPILRSDTIGSRIVVPSVLVYAIVAVLASSTSNGTTTPNSLLHSFVEDAATMVDLWRSLLRSILPLTKERKEG